MGLSGARNSAVTGLQAQSTSISISADNIANASTPGYKAVKGQFSTLVTGSSSSAGYSSGGVSVNAQSVIEKQGLIENTGRVTDLAISGTGFFAVKDNSGTLLLSRAGSFDVNNRGELVNAQGLQLLGWPLDNNGRKPGDPGNLNSTAAESVNSLVIIDTNAASGTASATTSIATGLNLNSGQSVFQGATITLAPAVSSVNGALLEDDIVVPVPGLQRGDTLSVSSNSVTTNFIYGGFAESIDVTNAPVFGATSANTAFSTGTSLANGDQFTITTVASGAVTFTFKATNPSTSAGEFNSLESLAAAIDSTAGLNARTSGGQLYVSSTDAREAISFADVGSSNLHKELGFSNQLAADSGVRRWNTFEGLSLLVNVEANLESVINNPTSAATIEIFSADPQDDLTVTKFDNYVTADLQSSENGQNASTDLIVPPKGTAVAAGDTLVFRDTQGSGGNTVTATYGGFGASADITASSIFGATTATGEFVNTTNNLDYTDQITFNDGTNNVVVTFVATPSVATEFNSLTTLAAAINQNANFVARVENGKLYVSAADANDAVTFSVTNNAGGVLTTANVATALGGDFGAGTLVTAAGVGVNRFNTLAQLQTIVNGTDFTAVIANASDNASVTISSTTPLTGLTVGDSSDDLIKELGISDNHDVGDGFFAEFGLTTSVPITATAQSGIVELTYDATDSTKNMAGGSVTPHFPRNIQVFDALGTGHDFRLSFLKIGVNTWAAEFYALDPTEISGNPDGLVASGTISFNGDGSLNSVSTSLTNAITIPWTTGAVDNSIVFDFGTSGAPSGTPGATVIGLTDGVRQFDASYSVEFIEQNGVAAGQFNGITVSEDGTISANFSNGEIKAIYKLPIITVASQNALSPQTGNTFAVTQNSGEVNLKDAGQSGAGIIVSGSLEGSTADIAEELTRTIGIQSNYNANATLISTVRDMEEELNRRL
jgi:flagellar hook protein FlgE